MENIPDHPVVNSLLRYGYPYGPEIVNGPICPICNRETETFYIDKINAIIGCEYCIEEVDAKEWLEDHKEVY